MQRLRAMNTSHEDMNALYVSYLKSQNDPEECQREQTTSALELIELEKIFADLNTGELDPKDDGLSFVCSRPALQKAQRSNDAGERLRRSSSTQVIRVNNIQDFSAIMASLE